LLVIDTQGALEVKKKIPSVLIFVHPPSLEELERRLRSRKTESEEVIQKRLSFAKQEIDKSRFYEYHVLNQDLEVAFLQIKSIVIAEECRRK